ncbi:MAG: phage integrase SAM-like domain-containing protein [Bacteroidales bacterium]|nr:phage integrase SAM-like domain-containing protein [Candidatus Colicola equi]
MITFKPTIVTSNKRKDGTFAVVMRVTYKGKSRRLATSMVARPEQLTRSGKIKDGTLQAQAERLRIQMQDAAAQLSPFDLEERDVDWVVAQIKARLNTSAFRLDFFAFAEEWLQHVKPQTRVSYYTALHAFARFIGRNEIDVNEIKRRMVLDFSEYLDSEPIYRYDTKLGAMVASKKAKRSGVASFTYPQRLGTIYKAARIKYNDDEAERLVIPGTPFDNLGLRRAPAEGQKPQSIATIQKMIDADFSGSRYHKARRRAFDALLLSFGLMGANMADLYVALNPSADTWSYQRAKTKDRRPDKAAMNVVIPPQMRPYIERLKGRGSKYWLNELRTSYANADAASHAIDKILRDWCVAEGIEPFTFYALRHSWADLARNECNVPKWLVDECLAHVGDFDLTDIYARRNWKEMAEANAKVLALFEWEK